MDHQRAWDQFNTIALLNSKSAQMQANGSNADNGGIEGGRAAEKLWQRVLTCLKDIKHDEAGAIAKLPADKLFETTFG